MYRVDRLRALQLTYQEQVEELEQTQERQRLTAQRSLKKEMHSLQKRLLENSVSPLRLSLFNNYSNDGGFVIVLTL